VFPAAFLPLPEPSQLAGGALNPPFSGQVRFDAPPAPLAGKGFSNEEIQKVLDHAPGSYYRCESEVYTSAMYGDKFAILTRYLMVARGPGAAALHVTYAIVWSPSLSGFLKPMIGKGVDGGWYACLHLDLHLHLILPMNAGSHVAWLTCESSATAAATLKHYAASKPWARTIVCLWHHVVMALLPLTSVTGFSMSPHARTSALVATLCPASLHPVLSRSYTAGGIRGTYGLIRKLLAAQCAVVDRPETGPPPALPGVAPPAAAAAELVPPAVPVPAGVPIAVAAGAGGSLGGALGLTDYLVYQELVAGLSGLPDPQLVVKALAVVAMLLLLGALVPLANTLVAPVQALCGSGAQGWISSVCWPLGHVVDVPDSVAEVMGALLLVWAANKLLVGGVALLAEYLK
jgi:hypothetical protein